MTALLVTDWIQNSTTVIQQFIYLRLMYSTVCMLYVPSLFFYFAYSVQATTTTQELHRFEKKTHKHKQKQKTQSINQSTKLQSKAIPTILFILNTLEQTIPRTVRYIPCVCRIRTQDISPLLNRLPHLSLSFV